MQVTDFTPFFFFTHHVIEGRTMLTRSLSPRGLPPGRLVGLSHDLVHCHIIRWLPVVIWSDCTPLFISIFCYWQFRLKICSCKFVSGNSLLVNSFLCADYPEDLPIKMNSIYFLISLSWQVTLFPILPYNHILSFLFFFAFISLHWYVHLEIHCQYFRQRISPLALWISAFQLVP
jgi:hypothetical protein